MSEVKSQSPVKERLLIVGNGMASGRFLEELTTLAPDRYEVTIYGDEEFGNYDRIQLSPLLAGERDLKSIFTYDRNWYESRSIELRSGIKVLGVSCADRKITLSDGETDHYDRLVIATGSKPFILPISGVDLEGVISFRTINDVQFMHKVVEENQNASAVVIGGGLLGIEAAYALQKQGLHVTLVHLGETLMDRQLDDNAGGLLQNELESRGIHFRMAHKTSEIVGDSTVESVRFSDGDEIPADLVVMAVGIVPRISIAANAGVKCERGVVVDDHMRTNDPFIYSVGECVQHSGVCYGLVAPLFDQAKVLAQELVGIKAKFEAPSLFTRLKVSGVDVFSAGEIAPDGEYDSLIYRDPEKSVYKKLNVRDGVLVGAVLYGDVLDSAWYFDLIEKSVEINAIRDYLIFGESMCAEIQSTMQVADSASCDAINSKRGNTTMSDKPVLVVVGNGMVGNHFIESFIEKDGANTYELITFCEEPLMAYDRVHLSEYFTDKTAEQLSLVRPGLYEGNNITVYKGESVTEINTDSQQVVSSTGRVVNYDKLVLATGSYAFVPPVEGNDNEGCLVYRTLQDLDEIKKFAANSNKGVVVGGGLLGLEAANALKSLGLDTHIVEFASQLMPVQLDEGGGKMLRNKIEDLGVSIHTSKNTRLIESGTEHRLRMNFTEGEALETDLILFSAGIRPRDELAKAANIKTGERGGISVNNYCETSVPNVFAIGECAEWNSQIFGLVAPGYTMARVAADWILGNEASFTGADMSTKLKLLGVDVGSIGDAHVKTPGAKTYTYVDEYKASYKKIVVSSDNSKLLGAVLIGDNSLYDTLLQYVLNGIDLPEYPDSLILPQRDGSNSVQLGPDALPDNAQICSCFNVTKGEIVASIEDGCMSLADVKNDTSASAGCGGCAPLLKSLVDSEFEKRGLEVNRDLCEHFPYTRQDLYNIVRVEEIRRFDELLEKHGRGLGCEICKPAAAGIFASTWNDYVLDEKHMSLQDTNDFALANIQKDGTYSVVPRIAGGEITPDGLIKIGEVGKKYSLYTKITGGQRIDMFGARLEQLPLIWQELTNAGFESGHAYGKAVRTVKSCVGSTWCRFGVQDSAGMSILIENRYKGLRTPHKTKFAVSGCTRECAEAQSKDVGIIATENGWNLYVCGNGGMRPRHADLLVTDLDDEALFKTIDRFLMFYIKTADKLQRTSVWMDNMEGGLDYLKQVIVEDSLGIVEDLEQQMQHIVDTYQDEWKTTLNSPKALKRFRAFVNSDATDDNVMFIEERGQIRPATESEKQIEPVKNTA